jgi:uncharacterized protein involved in exopolysaccharide biosynthesis
VTEDNRDSKSLQSDDIELQEIFRNIWGKRKVILKLTAIFFILGLIISMASPREYRSEVILLVETSSSASGMSGLLQQFGGLAGFGNFGSRINEDALTPELYPDIVKSTPFLLGLLNSRIQAARYDSTLMVSEFLDRHTRQSLGQLIRGYTIGLPGKIIGLFRNRSHDNPPVAKTGSGPLKLTPKQAHLARELSKRIKAREGESPNTLIITTEMQDPQLTAQLCDSVVLSLTNYIIEYRTQKAKADLNYIEQSHHTAEKKYIQAQRALAAFKDRNVNIVTASGQITEQNLQSEYTLTFTLYNTLSQQLEQARLKVQERTPVFKVVEPAKVPLNKSKPRTGLILAAMIILGGITGTGTVIGRLILDRYP